MRHSKTVTLATVSRVTRGIGANVIGTPTSVQWDRASPRRLKATEEEAGGQARRNQINIAINRDGGGCPGAWISCLGGKSLSITAPGGTGPEETNLRGTYAAHTNTSLSQKRKHLFARLAHRSLKNKKSLTAAEPTGCDDGTVIDIDAPSCCGSGAR